jgi:hypothetical protein
LPPPLGFSDAFLVQGESEIKGERRVSEHRWFLPSVWFHRREHEPYTQLTEMTRCERILP